MPHFSSCCPGADTYICQKCAKIFCSKCQPSQWRPDITGHKSAGNVCPKCLEEYGYPAPPESLYEHCKKESGLTDQIQIMKYIDRHYGHG